MTFHVLVPDSVNKKAVEILEQAGLKVTAPGQMKREETLAAITDADAGQSHFVTGGGTHQTGRHNRERTSGENSFQK